MTICEGKKWRKCLVLEGPHVHGERQKTLKIQKKRQREKEVCGEITFSPSVICPHILYWRRPFDRVSELGKLRESVINRDIMTNPFLPFKISPEASQVWASMASGSFFLLALHRNYRIEEGRLEGLRCSGFPFCWK